MSATRAADVFVDVCTQRDYLSPNGARPSVNASGILPRLRHLMAFARWAHIPTLSCVDARRPSQVCGLSKPDCVIGTHGQTKVAFSLLPDHVRIDSDNCLCVSLDVLSNHQQAILSKEHHDPFTNPKFDRLLTELPTRRFVVFGVSLETSVRLLALGLLLRHRQVVVVRDACGWWNDEDGEMAARQLLAKGCQFIGTEELVQQALPRYRRNGHARPYRRRSVA